MKKTSPYEPDQEDKEGQGRVEPRQAPLIDEHAGKGGSYMRDPQTGERVLLERTQA